MTLISIGVAEIVKLHIWIFILLGTCIRFAIGPSTDIEGASVNYNAPLILTKKGTHYELGTPNEVKEGKLFLNGDTDQLVLGFCPPQTEDEVSRSRLSDKMLFLRERGDLELKENRFDNCKYQVEPNTLIRVESCEDGVLYSSGYQIYIEDGIHDLPFVVETLEQNALDDSHDSDVSDNLVLTNKDPDAEGPKAHNKIEDTTVLNERKRHAWVRIFDIFLKNNDQPIYASYRLHSFQLFSTYTVQQKQLLYRHVLSKWKSNIDSFYENQERNVKTQNIDYLVPLQLVTYEDFLVRSWQLTTEDYRNTVPFYQSSGNENRWKEIGKIIRHKMATKECNFVDIFVGVHGEIQKLKLEGNQYLSVPELAWKLVRCNVNERKNETIVFIMRNIYTTPVKEHVIDIVPIHSAQTLEQSKTEGSSKIEDFCSMHGWDEISKLSTDEQTMDIYCCSVNSIESEFKISHLNMGGDDILSVKIKGL